MTTLRDILPAPTKLLDVESNQIEWGTFLGQVPNANIVDCKGLYLDKRNNYKRLKEWQAFQISDNQRFICGALYNGKQFGVIALSYYDKASKKHYLYKKFVRPSNLDIADGSLPSCSRYNSKKITFSISRDTSGKKTEVVIRWPASRKLPALELDATLTESAPGMSICQPFESSRPLYSYKNLMPAQANIKFNNVPVYLAPTTIAILDDHKGFYPRHVNYDWGTAGAYIDGKILGFNLTRNQIRSPETYNENCIWYDGELLPLPAIEVTHEKNEWHYQDKNGLVDVTFTPLVANTEKFHLGFYFMDYQGPFGLFDGYITHPRCGKLAISNMLGMAERKRYKL